MEGSTAPGGHSHRADIAAEPTLPVPCPLFPWAPVFFFFSSIFTVGSLRLFLACFAAVSCRMSELGPPPRRFSPAFTSRQLLLHPEIVIDVHTVLSFLLSPCLQPAATDCWSCCKWQAAVLGCAISKFSNRKVQFLIPLGRKTVPLQQQRLATGVQRVRTA